MLPADETGDTLIQPHTAGAPKPAGAPMLAYYQDLRLPVSTVFLFISVNTLVYEGWMWFRWWCKGRQFSLLLLLSTCLDTEALINTSGRLQVKSERDSRTTSDSNNLDHYGLSSFSLCDGSTACLTVVFHSSVMSGLSLISVNTLMSTVLPLQMSPTARNCTKLQLQLFLLLLFEV